ACTRARAPFLARKGHRSRCAPIGRSENACGRLRLAGAAPVSNDAGKMLSRRPGLRAGVDARRRRDRLVTQHPADHLILPGLHVEEDLTPGMPKPMYVHLQARESPYRARNLEG